MGNARTYLLAWLAARSQGGRLVLRMEDIDSPRIKAGAAEQAIADLRWLGLDWDFGPDVGGPHGPYVQTQRLPRYQAALARLQAAERVYPCTCTRGDVAAAASAPHVGQEGPRYQGLCAGRRAADADVLTSAGKSFCWRFRASSTDRQIEDLVLGRRQCNVAVELGDFVVFKSDGTPSYQLAVVVDDHAMGVTDVVRGEDLMPSAFRQLELFAAFGFPPPRFAHVPLVVGPDGRRLAKRHGDTRLAVLREQGRTSEALIGILAWTCGLIAQPNPCRPSELVERFSFDRLPRQPLVLSDEMWRGLVG